MHVAIAEGRPGTFEPFFEKIQNIFGIRKACERVKSAWTNILVKQLIHI